MVLNVQKDLVCVTRTDARVRITFHYCLGPRERSYARGVENSSGAGKSPSGRIRVASRHCYSEDGMSDSVRERCRNLTFFNRFLPACLRLKPLHNDHGSTSSSPKAEAPYQLRLKHAAVYQKLALELIFFSLFLSSPSDVVCGLPCLLVWVSRQCAYG